MSSVLGVAWYVYVAASADRALQEAVAETDRLDPGWRWEDLLNHRAAIPEDQNGSGEVLTIYRMFPKDLYLLRVQIGTSFQSLAPDQQLNAQQVASLLSELGLYGPALARAANLDRFSTGRYTFPEAEVFSEWSPPHISAVHDMSELLGWQAILQAQQGDAEGALASCRRSIIVARTLGDETRLGSQFLRCAWVSRALATVERTLAQGEASDSALETLQRLLEDEDRHPGLMIEARGMRAVFDHLLQKSQNIELTATPIHDTTITTAAILKRLVLPGHLKKERTAVLRHLTDLVEIANLPDGENVTRLRELENKELLQGQAGQLLDVWINGADKKLIWFLAFQTKRRCSLAALACERYRLRTGRWPPTLDALVRTGVLSKVPTDPFSGGRLRFQELADGVLIDSLETDPEFRRGEKHSWYYPQDEMPLGFRLWNVDKRRQPAN